MDLLANPQRAYLNPGAYGRQCRLQLPAPAARIHRKHGRLLELPVLFVDAPGSGSLL